MNNLIIGLNISKIVFIKHISERGGVKDWWGGGSIFGWVFLTRKHLGKPGFIGSME